MRVLFLQLLQESKEGMLMYASRNRLNYLGIIVLVAYFVVAPKSVAAISLEFVPVSQSVGLGSQATVDVIVADPGGALVGAYDFLVNYEPDVLTLNSVVFGAALGGGPPDSFQDLLESPAGEVNLSELSLLGNRPPQTVLTSQPLISSV
jgi:hypothetical protein